jgi:hypothetical protein
MAILFDGPNKLITLSLGTTALGIQQLWSEWVRWHATSDNGKYLPAMRLLGGDNIDAVASTTVPFYVYLQSGWRIKPQEANHTLTVSGGILLVEEGGDPFVDTVGGFTVRVLYQQPLEAINIGMNAAAIPTATEIASAVRLEIAAELAKINTATEIADTVWTHAFVSKLLTVAKFIGLK